MYVHSELLSESPGMQMQNVPMPIQRKGPFRIEGITMATNLDVFGNLIGRNGMKIKIVINTMEIAPGGQSAQYRTSEIWSGEMNILPKGEYLTKISILTDGIEHPICDIPFSVTMGYWQWVPPLVDDERMEEIEEAIIENTEPL